MSDEPIPSLAEAMAEIRRLRTATEVLDAIIKHERGIAEGLRARVTELEAAGAIQRGTLQMQTMHTTDGGTRFTWNVPPSAPPHND
jgi:hypothetical protein